MDSSITSHSLFSTALAITVLIFSLSAFSLLEASNGGFSVDLIHGSSPKSPLYNPFLSNSERIANALQYSRNRVDYYRSTSTPSKAASASLPIPPGYYAYLINISFGTPPVTVLGIVDTGSDLIWTQCKPCINCYKQSYPLFDPKNSSTFKVVSCASDVCGQLPSSACQENSGSCQYSYSYVDKSYTLGLVATDTVTLGSTIGPPLSVPQAVFGCGFENNGTFNFYEASYIGFGGGPLSLISQLGSSIGGVFSHHFVPQGSPISGKLNFGENGVVSGPGVVSTPIVVKPPLTYYHLTLEGFSVENERIDFYNSSLSSNASFIREEGNIVIDSGTTFTFLPVDLYLRVEAAVKRYIPLEPLKNPPLYNLCYPISVQVPLITAHFKGADVKLYEMNTFTKLNDTVVCFAFFNQTTDIAFFGNVAQINFLVGYDLQKLTVSFKPADFGLQQ